MGGRSRPVRTRAGACVLPKAPSAGIFAQSRGAAWSCLDPERSARGHQGAPAVRPPTPSSLITSAPGAPLASDGGSHGSTTPGAERGAETSGRGPSAAERALPEAPGGPRSRLARPVVAVAVETGILQFAAALGRSQAAAPVETEAEL